MLTILPKRGGCYDCCFDEKGEYIHSYIKDDKALYKREAGCQSTYLPYSFLDIEAHLGILGKRLVKNIIEPLDASFRYTSIGSPLLASQLNIKTNDRYIMCEEYDVVETKIANNKNCDICR